MTARSCVTSVKDAWQFEAEFSARTQSLRTEQCSHTDRSAGAHSSRKSAIPRGVTVAPQRGAPLFPKRLR